MAPQVGSHFLEREHGGRGVLLGGAPGVRPARVVVIGAGNVGWNAAWIAQGMEAEVLLFDRNLDRLRWVDQIHKGRIMTLASNRLAVERAVAEADLVIGAVLVPGGRAPVVVTEAMVRSMRPGAVIVDCAIDQGGSVEDIHETSHADPVYERHGVLHYAVGNIPGAVPHTSTYALTNATLPYAVALATEGVHAATAARSRARRRRQHRGRPGHQRRGGRGFGAPVRAPRRRARRLAPSLGRSRRLPVVGCERRDCDCGAEEAQRGERFVHRDHVTDAAGWDAVRHARGSWCAQRLKTAAITNPALTNAAAHCAPRRGSFRGRVMASVRNRIAGMRSGKNRNENERKHIGSRRSPAVARSQGRCCRPRSARTAGVATTNGNTTDPQSPGSRRVRAGTSRSGGSARR